MSQRSRNRSFSADGFRPLTRHSSDDMANDDDPHDDDLTKNVPLKKVNTSRSAGARKADATSPSTSNTAVDFPEYNEKKSNFLRRGPGGRRKKVTIKGRERRDSDDGTYNAAGRLYNSIFRMSLLSRYFIYVAPLAFAIAIPVVIGATVAPNAKIGGVPMVWFFTWIQVVWCSLWVSKLVARLLPALFQFFCGVVSAGTRKYALVISALEIPLSLVGWSLTSLTTFVPLMTLNPHQRAVNDTGLQTWEDTVKNILFACFFSTLVFLGEKLLIELLAISYHRKQFDDRIKRSKRDIYLISLLYDASRALFPAYCAEFVEEDYLISDVLDIASSGRTSRHGHKRSGSATPLRLIQNVARVGDKVTAAFGNVAQEITGKQVFDRTSAHSIVVEAMEKKHSSEALARRIWMSFVLEGKEALYHEDILDVLGPERAIEAEEAFERLDVDGNGDISLDEMLLRVGEIGRERASIANSMHDVDQAIHVLDNLLLTAVFVFVIFIFVAWLNKSFTTTLATAGTTLLSLSFVFSVTAQEVLGSCIFLFVKHPYDVGDRVDISNEQYVVERISLLYTAFRRVKDYKRTQAPNIVLNTLWVENITRSKAMRERLLIYIDIGTSLEDIELLKKEMLAFVRDKDNSRDFQPDMDIEVTGLANMDKMELQVEIRHKSNWANETVRAARRSKFMCALVLALRKVPIYGPAGSAPVMGDAANPTYSVSLSNKEASTNQAKFADDLDKKRMVPLQPLPSNTSATSSAIDFADSEAKERAYMEGLNKRDLNYDATRDTVVHEEEDAMLERKRTNDIEEVSNMLRRGTTIGRRKPSQQNALSPVRTRFASNVPILAEVESAPAAIPLRSPSTLVAPSSPAAPADRYTTASMQEQGQGQTQSQYRYAGPNVPPIPMTTIRSSPLAGNTGLDLRSTSPIIHDFDAPRQSPNRIASPSRYVPGNAFSQQQHYGSPQPPSTRSGNQG